MFYFFENFEKFDELQIIFFFNKNNDKNIVITI